MKSYKDYEKKAASVVENETVEADAEALTRKIASAYQGKSNASVLKSILEEAEKSKRAGTLSNEEIENFYKSFAPMLSGFQKKQLRAVVEKLKEI
jgi:DNA replication protein DnaD